MRSHLRSGAFPLLLLALAAASDPARAQVRPSLDDVLATTLDSGDVDATAAAGRGGDLCRTMTDRGRRSRRVSVCMTSADWETLVRAAQASTGRGRALRISSRSSQDYRR